MHASLDSNLTFVGYVMTDIHILAGAVLALEYVVQEIFFVLS